MLTADGSSVTEARGTGLSDQISAFSALISVITARSKVLGTVRFFFYLFVLKNSLMLINPAFI